MPAGEKLAWALLIGLLLYTFGLRLYALFYATPIVTWDDLGYRRDVFASPLLNNPLQALKDIFALHDRLNSFNRTVGYQTWLIFISSLLGVENAEFVFQLCNVFFYFVQFWGIYKLAFWSSRNNFFSISIAAFFIASPIVFGVNRWVMTEVYVLTILILLPQIPIYFINHNTRSHTWQAALLGLALGVSSGVREYVWPNVWITLMVTVWILLQRPIKWKSVIFFIIPVLPYLWVMFNLLPQVIEGILWKGSMTANYHPLSAWLQHSFLYSLGPALSIIMILAILDYIRKKIGFQHIGFRTVWNEMKTSPERVMALAYGATAMMYFVGILVSINMQARMVIPPVICLLIAWLSARRARMKGSQIDTRWYWLFSCLFPVAAAVLTYTLIFQFDGATYTHHWSNLEFYNYPLNLRQLPPSLMHVQ